MGKRSFIICMKRGITLRPYLVNFVVLTLSRFDIFLVPHYSTMIIGIWQVVFPLIPRHHLVSMAYSVGNAKPKQLMGNQIN